MCLQQNQFDTIRKSFKNQILNYKNYRLSDCILQPNNQYIKNYNKNTNIYKKPCNKYHYELWPDSIAGRYSLLNNFKSEINYDLILDIILEKYPQLCHNTVAMHLRVGDGLLQFHKKYKPLEFYANKKWTNNNAYNITLVFGCHNWISWKMQYQTEKYISDLTDSLIKISNKPLQLRTTEEPDEDFIFLLFSRYYVASGGGWSILLKKLRPMINSV